MPPLVEIEALAKTFHSPGVAVEALKNINLNIEAGEFVALAGPSGSGKTTLLNLIGALDFPTQGRLRVEASNLGALNKNQRAEFRLTKIGFVFQALNLIPVLTARENVEYVMLLQGYPRKARREKAAELLAKVGLSDYQNSLPTHMSGGQQQRVAIARALATRPPLVLADEPTANLDSKTGENLIALFRELNREYGTTFIVASHDPVVLQQTPRLIRLLDGEIVP